MPDSIRWTTNSTGVFSSKSFCDSFQDSRAIKNDVWKLVWANLALPKVEFFVWKAVHNRLPTRVELYTRGLVNIQSVVCPFCLLHPESVSHLFCHCKAVWEVCKDGKILISFSKFVGFIDPTTAELFAIREACLLFCKSPWCKCANLILECDSKLAVDWLMLPYSTPVVFKLIIRESRNICSDLVWSISLVPRDWNSLADILAKSGLSRKSDCIYQASFVSA
ncbi:hypothetical protein V6N13_101241 [Hibiscus sabdariffa]